MKVLIVAPHPDDEVLGCGGAIAKHITAGDEVSVCVVTKSYTPDWSPAYLKTEMAEFKKASDFLSIKKTFSLELPAVKLDLVGQKKLNDELQKVANEVKPEILYIPFWGDINSDHRMISEACLVVARPKPGTCIKKVLAYEALSETEWGPPVTQSFVPNVYLDISATIKQKLRAMECYQSQLIPFPHPRSLEGIEILAKKRGMEVGLPYAEAFLLVRDVKP